MNVRSTSGAKTTRLTLLLLRILRCCYGRQGRPCEFSTESLKSPRWSALSMIMWTSASILTSRSTYGHESTQAAYGSNHKFHAFRARFSGTGRASFRRSRTVLLVLRQWRHLGRDRVSWRRRDLSATQSSSELAMQPNCSGLVIRTERKKEIFLYKWMRLTSAHDGGY